ncbi:MAG: D-alanyl-D-alanine carboxypeptidase/D-alanyl-D-alanine-endopeptidase [Bacteroidia bacterium]|nr:D-alanyl-D-alanine carboxypeptidase/D-alanyl-D-alanine-endopeptidase [Bacteroidia bacterium]
MKICFSCFSVCFFLMFSMSLFAQNTTYPQLNAAIKALDNEEDMRSASWSICVMDAVTGQIIAEFDKDRNLATASTMKTVSTATALSLLGPDYRFETLLQYDGKINSEGVLEGNIYIKGSGDPSLGSDRFGESYDMPQMMNAWSLAVKAAGIKSVSGKIIGDESGFSSQLTPGEWPWEDMGNYYGAGSGGLNINENLYRLDLKPGTSVGSATEVIRTDPPVDIVFVNELTTGSAGSGDNAYIFGSPYTNLRYIRGTIPAGNSVFSIKGSMPDPAFFCAQRFTEELNLCGIKVSGTPSTSRLEKMKGNVMAAARKNFYTHSSPPLRDIIYQTNMFSVNLFAEALAKKVAVEKGRMGDTKEGTEAMEEYWRAQGIITKGMLLRDGSGLSPNNVISTYQLTSILARMYKSRYFADFDASLPIAGKSGSLKSMLKGTVAENRLRAKSGFISGVRAYAGYAEMLNGKPVAFAIIANHFSCSPGEMRRKMEVLMVKIVEGK